jgi:hypothetical protein
VKVSIASEPPSAHHFEAARFNSIWRRVLIAAEQTAHTQIEEQVRTLVGKHRPPTALISTSNANAVPQFHTGWLIPVSV